MELMERRRTERLKLAIPLSVSVLNSSAPGHGTESVNVSAGGMYFSTNLPLRRGTGVQLLFKMPEEITRTPASDWVCMGHVVHVKPISAPNGWLGVGVQFDCYEIVPAAKSLAGFDPLLACLTSMSAEQAAGSHDTTTAAVNSTKAERITGKVPGIVTSRK